MATITVRDVETYELAVDDATLVTSPPRIVVSAHAAQVPAGMTMRFRHKGRGLAITEEGSGIVVGWSKPERAHEHCIRHRGRRWHLEVQRSLWGSPRPFRRGFVTSADLGAVSIESSHNHYVSEWRAHRRLHRGWTTGSILVEGDVPDPVLALALRLTLGSRWFELRTGDWTETRREWDFGGF